MLLPAYLWLVDKEIDFTPIQACWADIWEALGCWGIIVDAKKDETPAQLNARQATITQRLSQPGVSQQALREFRMFGAVPSDSAIWEGIDTTGLQIHRYISSARVRREPRIRDVIARIIFDILIYTLSLSEDPQRAQGLANSIWQSVRVDQVPGSEEPLPDKVNDGLFSHKDVRKSPFATLQLDETLDDNFAQLWFVDRIMEKGRLWCGTYQRSSSQFGNAQHRSSHELASSQELLDAKLTAQPGPSTSTPVNLHNEEEYREPRLRSIIQRQVLRQMTTAMVSFHNQTSRSLRYPTVTLMEAPNYDYWSDNAEQRRERNLTSAFDVDGPCQIATPFNPNWEILPRPKLRSMSACWVLEHVENKPSVAEPSHDTLSQTIPHLGNTEEGAREKPTSDPSTMNDSTDMAESFDPVEGSRSSPPAFRVVRKVKGLWQIMDLPSQEYIFS